MLAISSDRQGLAVRFNQMIKYLSVWQDVQILEKNHIDRSVWYPFWLASVGMTCSRGLTKSMPPNLHEACRGLRWAVSGQQHTLPTYHSHSSLSFCTNLCSLLCSISRGGCEAATFPQASETVLRDRCIHCSKLEINPPRRRHSESTLACFKFARAV